MIEQSFLEELKEKYNYDNKVIKALSLIIPSMINYYGDKYKSIILDAISSCEIIPCNSHQTISKVLNDRKLTKFVGASLVSDIDIKRAESVYVPNVKLIYNQELNIYEIKKIDRIIVTSHTFNYDSLKGIEVLTHALCHLIKSYNKEFTIDGNVLTIRSGLSYEIRKIVYNDGDITLDFIEDYGRSMSEGLCLYDTEKIVSNVYHTNYKCYDYETIYTIATILKEKYKLKNDINKYEIIGTIDDFKEKYNSESIDNLCLMCDECLVLENDMLLSYTREDKNNFAKLINKKLNEEIYQNLVSIYDNKSVIRN